MNTCKSFSDFFSEYVENNVHPEQKETLDLHLAQCPSCHAAVARLENLRMRMRALPRLKTSHDFETLLRARIMIERKRTAALPFWPEFARMPRSATYAFAGLLLLLATGMLLQKGQSTSAFAKHAHHEELRVFTLLRPATSASEKIFFSLDQIRPTVTQTQPEFKSPNSSNVPLDSLPKSRVSPTGTQLRTASF